MKRKIIIAICMILSAIFCLSACGTKPERPIGSSEANSVTGGGDGDSAINYDGVININLPLSEFDFYDNALKAVADAYMELHPESMVNIVGWSSSTYKDQLDSQFAGGATNTSADVVQTLLISNAYLSSKMLDYSIYLTKPNPYNDNKPWVETLKEEAYPVSDDRSGIYTLNFATTSSYFFYNKSVWRAAGLTNSDGTDKIPATWDELVSFCQQIKSKTGKIPMALSGSTYTTGPMCWLYNVYTDQYYRSSIESFHAEEGDYCYDPDIDADWIYDVNDKDIDAPSKCTINPLKFYKAIADGDISPNDAKYKAMISNFSKIIPQYCQTNYVTDNVFQSTERFWTQEAAMVYYTTDLLNTYKKTFESRGEGGFDIGFFKAPPMTGSGNSAPTASTVRSVGGAIGWQGVVKKDKEHNDLVVDFMMFWGSPQGQKIYFDRMLDQEAYVGGESLVMGVEIPDEIYPTKQFTFAGLCENNPMGNFWGNLVSMNGSQTANQTYESNMIKYYNGQISLDQFCSSLENALKTGLSEYMKGLGWREKCYDTPHLKPNISN